MRQLLVAFCILSLFAAFSPAMAAQEVTFTGKVTRVDLEGGFWGIVAQDGAKYDPMNLPPEFMKDGMEVTVNGVVRDDVMSMRMWGKILEIKDIKAADPAVQPAKPAGEIDENLLISVTRLGRGRIGWNVDKLGNCSSWFTDRMAKRQEQQVKLTDAQLVELKKHLESVEWDALKPIYQVPQDQVVEDEEGPLQTAYKVVVMVEGKPRTTTVVNPGANSSIPEGLAKAVNMVISIKPEQPVVAPQPVRQPRVRRPRPPVEEDEE